MAFSNVGNYSLAPGQTGRYYISFAGADKGPQLIVAHPLNPGGSLQVDDQTKTHNTDGTIFYWLTVKNIGTYATNFSLQGGGLS